MARPGDPPRTGSCRRWNLASGADDTAPSTRLRPGADGAAPSGESARRLLRTPLVFESNVGQFAADVRFAARLGSGLVAITDDGLAIEAAADSGAAADGSVVAPGLTVRFDGSRTPVRPTGEHASRTRVHYLLGRDPAGWQRDVPSFDRVRFAGLYPGIDLVVYATGRAIEYDLIVAPGADPSGIGFRFDGADRIERLADGTLKVVAGGLEVRQGRALAHQVRDGRPVPVETTYEPRGTNQVALRVGSYQPDIPLVVDPVLAFATYLGGRDMEMATAVATDATGAIYLLAQTYPGESGFPASTTGSAACCRPTCSSPSSIPRGSVSNG